MYLLGIDVGTGGTRALVIDESGRVISSATEEHQPFASLKSAGRSRILVTGGAPAE